ncbi:MAG: hypothetical protein V2J65_16160 [Desulfobacteraceae bacterium]|nr:hypothetical protein [Desulfobacteraceae bacterium]
MLAKDSDLSQNNRKIWIITDGRSLEIDLKGVVDGSISGPYKQYMISEIGRYLLNPQSIEVKKKLIGGEIHCKQGVLKNIAKPFRKLLPKASKHPNNGSQISPELIVSRYKTRVPPMKDPDLAAHLNQFYGLLKSYDSVPKKLALLDPQKLAEIIGICEDIGGNYSYLKLKGSIEEKIKYLETYFSKEVSVILNRAYVADGLFELRGYDFASYTPARSYRLVSFSNDGEPTACVLTDQNKIDFQLNDVDLIKHMHLLEQSLRANPSISEAFSRCVEGQATPIKLFFNKKLEIDYAKTALPAVYQNVFKMFDVGRNQRNLIKPILNYLQVGVSLNYILPEEDPEDRLYTHISVLHDFRALEPLRKNLPQVYSALLKQAFFTEAGRYYLLDSINGYSNE